MEVAEIASAEKIDPAQSINKEMSGGQIHPYRLDLEEGQFVRLIVDQQGIDVVIRLFGPEGGSPVTVVDSPTGTQGPETVIEVAAVSGSYGVEVRAVEKDAPAGHYELTVPDRRPANQEDGRRVRAERAFAEADELRRKRSGADNRQALEKYGEALSIWQQEIKDQAREAETLYRLGWVSQRLGRFDAAMDYFEKALPLLQEAQSRFYEGRVLNRMAAIRFRLGHDADAVRLASTALEISKQIGDKVLEAAALINLGNAYNSMGEVQNSLECYQAGRSLSLESGDRIQQRIALIGIGDLLLYQGKSRQALDALEQSLRLAREQESVRGQAAVLNRMANVHQRMGEFDRALQELDEALELIRRTDDPTGEATVLNSMGTVHLKSSRLEEAGDCYRQALSISSDSQDRRNQAFAHLNLGRYHYERGEFDLSAASHDRAAELFENNRRGRASTLFGSARALHKVMDYSGAQEKLEAVLEDVESLRSETESPDLRMTYFATRQHYFDLHIDTLMHLHQQDDSAGHATQALQVSERRRARGLIDLLVQSNARISRGVDPTLLDRERKLQEELNASERILMRPTPGRNRSQRIANEEKRQRGLLRELDEVRTQIRVKSPQYADLTRPRPLTLDEIKEQVLDEETLLLVYSLGDERSFLWCVSHQGSMSSHVLPSRSMIEGMAREVYKGWSRFPTADQTTERWAVRLGRTLLDPVADRLGNKRLLIVSEGALLYVPFAALPHPSGTGPLVERHEVVTSPSASTLASLRTDLADRLPAPRRIAVVADPVFNADDPRVTQRSGMQGSTKGLGETGSDLARSASDLGIPRFERLPFSRDEAQAIQDLVPGGQRFEALGFDASRETFLGGQLARYRILHIATHGLLNRKHPELSGLVLSLVDDQGRPRDGFVRAHELFNLDLPAELIVLSACETGLGQEIKGEGLVGLTRGFMYAGAPRIVVSLWKVNDQATSELMRRFYKLLFDRGESPSSALRLAQLSMLKDERWKAPNFWSGFIFQGEWSTQRRTKDDPIERAAAGADELMMPDDDLPPPMITIQADSSND